MKELDSIWLATDDVLIEIFSFLSIRDILAFRQTCKRVMAISMLKVVWTIAYQVHVVQGGFPLPKKAWSLMEMPELEHKTRHAVLLGSNHRSPLCCIPKSVTWRANSTNAISDVCLLPGHGDRWLLTVSKGIWSQISCWDLYPSGGTEPRKLCDWGPRGAILKGIAVNVECYSSVELAVGITHNDETRIDLLSFVLPQGDGRHKFHPLKSFQCGLRPMTLQGDLLAASNDLRETKILDYNTGAEAVLRSSADESVSQWEYNRCLQVVFARHYVFVARARSIEIYPQPELLGQQEGTYIYLPVASHSFGWLDAISVAPAISHSQSFSVLFRCKDNDPWSQDKPTLNLYSLAVQPSDDDPTERSPPLLPTLSTQTPLLPGSLHCNDLILGPCGTAIWICPHQCPTLGLVQTDTHGEDAFRSPIYSIQGDSTGDCLMLGIFPGPLTSKEKVKPLYWNPDDNWTSMDYSEGLGRVVLGRSDGLVTLLEL